MSRVRVGVVGNIGVGKSTLVEMCTSAQYSSILLSAFPHGGRNGKIHSFFETFDTERLDQYYRNPKKEAFSLQCEFLQKRLEREKIIQNLTGIIIEDRTLGEDYHIFGKAQLRQENMTAAEFQQYEAEYERVRRNLSTPDILVYLRASTPTLQKRIQERSRGSEKQIHPGYLALLNILYEEYVEYVSEHLDSPVIIINADNHTDRQIFFRDTIIQIAEQIRTLSIGK